MERSTKSLRLRIALGCGVIGVLLGLMFAGIASIIRGRYEQDLLDGILRDLASDPRLQQIAAPGLSLSLSGAHLLRGYLHDANGGREVAAPMATLPIGFHDVESADETNWRVGVFDVDGERLFLAIDLDDIEDAGTRLARILGVAIIGGSLIAAWLGWLFAGRMMAPVRRLAEAVEAFPDHAEESRLSGHATSDELGRLASAIDGYQRRLIMARMREREFFADASHELRTPLAVVLGTVELLLDDDRIGEPLRQRLRRLDRGTRTLADSLDVMLGLARGMMGPVACVDTESWLRESLGDLGGDAFMQLHIDRDARRLNLRSREAGLVIRGIVRHLLRSGTAARLDVTVGSGTWEFRRTARASAGTIEETFSRGERSATLGDQLATRMAWSIERSGPDGGVVSITLPGVPV